MLPNTDTGSFLPATLPHGFFFYKKKRNLKRIHGKKATELDLA
jgi:hypothetical protein